MALNNSFYQSIMRRYDLLQDRNRHVQNSRLREIYEAIPQYEKLENEITSVCAEAARENIRRRLPAARPESETAPALIGPLRQKVDELRRQQTELLTVHGYAPDYLQMHYQCPDCKDTGWINGHKCRCFQKAVSDELSLQSNLNSQLQDENFDTFNLNYYPERNDPKLGISPRRNMEDVLKKCREFILHFDEKPANLFIYGKTGVGKTFLTHCIAKELMDASKTVLYLTSFELIGIFESHTFGSSDMNDEIAEGVLFEALMDCDVLIIDDLGTEMTNTFTISQLFLCINERQLRKKSTIISTNLSLEEIQDTYSERIFARIVSHYEILLLIGDDIRIQKALS